MRLSVERDAVAFLHDFRIVSTTSLPPAAQPGETPPLYKLPPRNFERICRDLLREEEGIATSTLWGAEGQAQQGIDVRADARPGLTTLTTNPQRAPSADLRLYTAHPPMNSHSFTLDGEPVDIRAFLSANDFTPDEIAAIHDLPLGEEIVYGGGAAATFVLRRVRSDPACDAATCQVSARHRSR